jgi:hypothetical protein
MIQEFGDRTSIQRTLDDLTDFNKMLVNWRKSGLVIANITDAYRIIDGKIMLSVYARRIDDAFYAVGRLDWPIALFKAHHRSAPMDDMIEFANPVGEGYVIMSAARVPRYTTNLVDALGLLATESWRVHSSGLVVSKHGRQKFINPEFSVCAVGLMTQLARRPVSLSGAAAVTATWKTAPLSE